MLYILENESKIISNFSRLEKQRKYCFQTKSLLENYLFVQKLQGKLLLKLTMATNLCNCNSNLCH